MFDEGVDLPEWNGSWLNRLVARPSFQSWASRMPIFRHFARKDGQALFDVLQGFVQSQVLTALVQLEIFERLRGGPRTPEDLGRETHIQPDRMRALLQAGAALDLLKRRNNGFSLSRKGAALMGVPGLQDMIRHHRAFYRDLEDPVALLRGPETTELSQFWPYVFGLKGAVDPSIAATYSQLMSRSQLLVAEDTLRQVSLSGVKQLLDVGGGTGAFLTAVAREYPKLPLSLFDLEQVVASAPAFLAQNGLSERVQINAGSFREDPLPTGADAISLIRVLYDHSDDTVFALLQKVFETLPKGGRLIVSEPMGGGAKPERSGDVYFAFYTMAMQTGKARAAEEISAMCERVGFTDVRSPNPARPFVTRVLTCKKPK